MESHDRWLNFIASQLHKIIKRPQRRKKKIKAQFVEIPMREEESLCFFDLSISIKTFAFYDERLNVKSMQT
jgi:hypothetical protein